MPASPDAVTQGFAAAVQAFVAVNRVIFFDHRPVSEVSPSRTASPVVGP